LEINDIESIWLEVNISHFKSILLNFIYSPPNSSQSWIDLYNQQLELLDTLELKYHILGHLNINYIPGKGKYNNTKWTDFTIKYGLKQLIHDPTRISKNSSIIIDHIYTNSIEHISECFTSELSLSDQFPICFTHSMKCKMA